MNIEPKTETTDKVTFIGKLILFSGQMMFK